MSTDHGKKFDLPNSSSLNVKMDIKVLFVNGVSVVLFMAILGLCSLPSIFYFTAKKPIPTNGTSARSLISNVSMEWSISQRSLPCNKPLIPSNGSQCVLPCGWKPWKKQKEWQIRGTTYAACLLAILSFILVLLTWLKIPQLSRFPNFIVVIMLGQSTIIVMLVSIGQLLGDDVFCSSKFLLVALQKATTFCKFEGVLLHYLEGSVASWFTVYNIVVAKGLVFDKVQVDRSDKWPFLVSALVCWLVPIIPVIFVLNSREGYSALFYNNFCFPATSDLVYYTAILPENILFAVGVTFLYVVIWKILKDRNASITASEEQARHRKNRMNKVLARLTLLMISYAATVYLTYGSMCYTLNKAGEFQVAIQLYFHCLTTQPHCPADYRKYISHIPHVLNYVSAALFPVSTVLFLVANEKARRLWKTPFIRFRGFVSRSTSVTHLINEEDSHRHLLNRT